MTRSFQIIVTLNLFFCFFIATKSQSLKAVLSPAKLPYPSASHSIYYDGADDIYIMAGEGGNSNQISRYSLKADTVELLGTLPGRGTMNGPIQMDSEGNLYYFAGYAGDSVIKYYPPPGNMTEIVAHHKYHVHPLFYALKPNVTSNKVLLLEMGFEGESSRGIGSFDMERYTFRSFNRTLPPYVSLGEETIVQFNSNIAYIVHTAIFGLSSIWELNLESFGVRLVSGLLPIFKGYGPEATSDGKSLFIVAGFENHTNEGFLRFEPASGRTSFLYVDNWPAKDGSGKLYIHPPKVVHIEKLNRLYFFGGMYEVISGVYTDEIFYVDLDPLNDVTPPPPMIMAEKEDNEELKSLEAFDSKFCQGVNYDIFPHPTNCSAFVTCNYGDIDIFFCPHGYHFDGREDHKYCNYANLVDCLI